MRISGSPVRVRWIIFSFLFVFAFINYFQRLSVSVAAERMMPELGLSQMQIGWLLTAFTIAYTAFQFPGGVFGQRVGARRALLVIGALAFLATLSTAFAPVVLTGGSLMLALLVSRFALGVAHAPLYPVSSGVIECWFPTGKWGLPQGLQVTGLGLGAAAAPPLLSVLMSTYGWQNALIWTALPVVGVLALWWWVGRDNPADHPRVGAQELAELALNEKTDCDTHISWQRLGKLLADKNILFLTASYLLMNYLFYLVTFWSFLYLVQERHFNVLESGWLASLPFLTAAIAAGIGGGTTDWLCARLGPRWGYRLIPVIALPCAGLMLILAVTAANPYWAVVGLCLCFACVEVTEGPYWAATMQVARSDTMAATGVLNTGANLGGVIATPLVALMSAHHGWNMAFFVGAAISIASAALWLGVDTSRPILAPEKAPVAI